MDIVIKKLKRGPMRAVADREVWVDGEHRATFSADRSRCLFLQPAHGSGSIYKMMPPRNPVFDSRDEELAMALRSSFLPGQRGEVDRRTRAAFAHGFLTALRLLPAR